MTKSYLVGSPAPQAPCRAHDHACLIERARQLHCARDGICCWRRKHTRHARVVEVLHSPAAHAARDLHQCTRVVLAHADVRHASQNVRVRHRHSLLCRVTDGADTTLSPRVVAKAEHTTVRAQHTREQRSLRRQHNTVTQVTELELSHAAAVATRMHTGT